MQVPVLSHRPEVHDELAGAPSWDNAIRALSLAKELGLSTSLVTVLTAVNVDHFRHVLRLAELIACDRVIVNRFHAAGQGVDYADRLSLSAEEFDAKTVDVVGSYQLEVVFGTGEVLTRDPVDGRNAIRREALAIGSPGSQSRHSVR